MTRVSWLANLAVVCTTLFFSQMVSAMPGATTISSPAPTVHLASSRRCAANCQQTARRCQNFCDKLLGKDRHKAASCRQNCANRYYVCKRSC